MKNHIQYCATLFYLLLSTTAFSQAPDVQWERGIGGQQNDYAYCVRETMEGNLVMVGSSNSSGDMPGAHGVGYDVFVAVLSPLGVPLWGKAYGGDNEDYAYAIRQTPDSGFIIAGATRSTDGDVSGGHGDFDMWVLKISRLGDVQWQKTLGGSAADYAYDIQVTSDTGFIVAGRSASNDGDLTANKGSFDLWVVKLSSTGAIQWQRSLGGTDDENAASVVQLTNGDYLVAGDTYSNNGDVSGNHGGQDYWILRFSATGSLLSKKCYGGTGSDYAQCIRQTPDGGYIVTGGSNSIDGDVGTGIGGGDVWMLKLSPTLGIEWERNAGSNAADVGYSVEVMADSSYLISGYVSAGNGDVTEFHGQGDYWVVKMSRTGNIVWSKAMGGLGNENANSAQQLRDGSFVMVGNSTIAYTDWPVLIGGRIEMYVIKLNVDNEVGMVSSHANVSIYPNPVTDNLVVDCSEDVYISVQDLTGRVVADTKGKIIPLVNCQPGLYIVSVFGEDGVLLKRKKLLKL
ncbi:MAG: T9SS type A sorting domain-containing protein [Taibaiella sp.]|nr:T9SS type A sorting domain-containing protein [Taibaiella sp.]